MENLNYVLYVLLTIVAFFVFKSHLKTKNNLSETRQALAGVSGDINLLTRIRITIQDILISYVLKLIADTMIVDIEDQNITDSDGYLLAIQTFINDKTQQAIIDSSVILPDLLVNQAKLLFGEDSYNQFIEMVINTVKAEYLDPFINEISGIVDAVNEPRFLMDKWTSILNKISVRVDTPTDIRIEDVLDMLPPTPVAKK